MPSVRQLVALCVLVGLVVAGGCVLFALTPPAGRVDALRRLDWPSLVPSIAAVVAAVGAWLGIRRVQDEHGGKLDQIAHQTNGVLDARIRQAMAEVFVGAGGVAPAPLPPHDPPADIDPPGPTGVGMLP